MKNRHLTIYVGDQEPRDKPAFLWIHRDPVTKYILFQINNGVDNWETITDSSMIAENLQHTLDILSVYIEDAQEAIEAVRALAEDTTSVAVTSENNTLCQKCAFAAAIDRFNVTAVE